MEWHKRLQETFCDGAHRNGASPWFERWNWYEWPSHLSNRICAFSSFDEAILETRLLTLRLGCFCSDELAAICAIAISLIRNIGVIIIHHMNQCMYESYHRITRMHLASNNEWHVQKLGEPLLWCCWDEGCYKGIGLILACELLHIE